MTPHPADRLALPPLPPQPEPPPFPLVGALAPLVLAAVLWAATRSPAMLLFAALSPVLAAAAVVDGRLHARRRARRATAARTEALAAVGRDLAAQRAALAVAAHRTDPTAATLAVDPESWAARPPSGRLVVGTADLPTDTPLVTGTAADDAERALLAAGRTVPAAPVTVPAETSVAVVGPEPLAGAFARGIALARLRATGTAVLPAVRSSASGAAADLVIAVDAAGATAVHASGPAAGIPVRAFTPVYISRPQLAAAVASGPTATGLADLLAAPAQGGLAARFLDAAGGGALDVDLVTEGPHAVVGGTTGSGKSQLLTAWILALAAAHPPDELVLLLVDCKGGAAFDPLAHLPQVAGVVTDLDPVAAERAVASLAAELRRRETVLRASGAADVASTDLPRLVVVVDEYRALTDSAPTLAALFADVASRGRSLGVHLILCTQRPGGALRSDVLANCGLRVALRMEAVDDSIAVLGDGAAARLPREPVGSVLVRSGGERARPARVATVDRVVVDAAVTSIRERAGASRAVPPWLPPLPARLVVEPAPAGLVALGALDLPAEQAQPALHWDPTRAPRLLVAGDPGSGRTGALAAVAAGLGAMQCATGSAALWDALQIDDVPLLIDDLDVWVGGLGGLGTAATERLAARLRNPAAAPTVVTVRGPAAWTGLPIRSLVGLFDETLLLRLGLDDHLALGGDRARHDATLPPGGGWWRGDRAQIGMAPPAPVTEWPEPPSAALQGGAYLVSVRPVERAAALTAAGVPVAPVSEAGRAPADAVLVGGPAEWQSGWRLLTDARVPVLVDGLGAGDVRALLGRSEALPPVDTPDTVVLLPREGAPTRVRLPC